MVVRSLSSPVLHLKPQTILRPAPGQQSCAGSRQNRGIFVWCRRIGILIVNRNYSPRPSGWAIILLIAAVLALAGCGRKGGLDLPPNAANASAQGAVADSEAERAAQPGVFSPGYGSDAAPTAARGNKRPFILDPLLGN